jgi:hypothetical protein
MNSNFKKFLCVAATLALSVTTAFGLSACSLNSDEVAEAKKNHTHTYSEEWTTDYNYHWHEATCSHRALMKNKAAHTFEDNTCTVCGYVKYVPNTDNQTPEKNDDNTGNTPETASGNTPEDTGNTGSTDNSGNTTDTTGSGETANTTGSGDTTDTTGGNTETGETTDTTGSGDTTSTTETSTETEVADVGIYTKIVKYIKNWYNPRNDKDDNIDVRSLFAYQKDDKYYLGYWATEHYKDAENTSGGPYYFDIELASDSPDEIAKVTEEQLKNANWHSLGASGIGIVNDYSSEGGFLNYREYDNSDAANASVVKIVKDVVKEECKDTLGDDFEVMYATMVMPVCDNDEIYVFEINALLRKDGKIYDYSGGIQFNMQFEQYLDEGETVDRRAIHDEVAQECFRQLAWAAENDQIQYMNDIVYWGQATDLGVIARDYNVQYEKAKQQSTPAADQSATDQSSADQSSVDQSADDGKSATTTS